MSASPSITSVQYAAGVITVLWNPDGGSTFLLTVTDTTAGTSTPYPGQSGFYAELTQTLSASGAYTITVACTDGGTTGPTSAAVPVISAQPAVTMVQNAVQSINLTWNATGSYSYVATLQAGTQSAQSQPTTDLDTSFPIQVPLAGSGNTASVQLVATAAGAQSLGPPTQYTVICEAPVLGLVDYSLDRDLTLNWNPLSGYTSFKAYLQPPTGSATVNFVTAQTTTFPGELGAGAYATYVCACSDDGVAIGPPSISYQPITSAPTMVQVVNTGAGLLLAWNLLDSYTTYAATMQQINDTSTTVPVTGTTYTFPGTPTGSGITCSVAAMSSDEVAIGPPSTTYSVIVDTPGWQMIAYDSAVLSLTWVKIADPTVTGYLIEISKLTPPNYATGDTDTTTVSATLTPLTSYPSTVRATNGIVWGPQSYALVPLTAPPLSPQLGYTGTNLRASWLPSGERNVTGYIAALLEDGASEEQISSAVSPQPFVSTFDLGVVFTSRIRATGTQTQGPWSAAAVGPYRTQLTYTFDSQERLQSIAWTGGATQTYSFDSAGNLLTANVVPPAS